MNIEIPSLSPWQQQAIDKATQRNLVNAGRQSGKSMLIIELVYEGIVKGQKMALLFPKYPNLLTHWNNISNVFFSAIAVKNKQEKFIEFMGGATLESYSAESADAMRGSQFDILIIDEAAHIKELKEVVEAVVLPTLLTRKGTLWMLSTPKGTQNYFNLCKNSGLWTVTQATSFDNPYLDPLEIEKLKLGMSPEMVQQELLGIPVDEQALTPFFYAYDPEQHFNQTVVRQSNLPLWFSFDFNVGIMSCVVAQVHFDYQIEVLALIQLSNSSVEGMCQRLKELYPHEIRMGTCYITGDASGNNRTALFTGNVSFYVLIKRLLTALDFQMKVPNTNLGHAQSQQLVNAVINNGYVTVASPELNRQMKALTIDDSGIVKDGNDHGTDCLRYLIHSLFNDYYTRPNKYLRSANKPLPSPQPAAPYAGKLSLPIPGKLPKP